MVQFVKTVIFSAKSKRRGVSAKEFTYEVAANKIFLHRVQVRQYHQSRRKAVCQSAHDILLHKGIGGRIRTEIVSAQARAHGAYG